MVGVSAGGSGQSLRRRFHVGAALRRAAGSVLAGLAAVAVVAVPAAGMPVAGSVSPDSVVAVASAGIVLHVPADGRVNGEGFTATVTGYRFAPAVGFGGSVVEAAEGQRLLVFGLREQVLVSGVTGQTGTSGASGVSGSSGPGSVAVSLVVDGASQLLASPATGLVYYRASVPAAAGQVWLQVVAAGVTQSFSFLTGRRVGAQPAALYRSAGSWETIDPLGQQVSFPVAAGAGNNVELTVRVASATLSWFGPAGVGPPPSPGDAWLVLSATGGTDLWTNTVRYAPTLPGSQVTLSRPGGPVEAARIAGRGGPADETTPGGLFGGVYYFLVPADLRTATVTVTPGVLRVSSLYTQTERIPGSAVFHLSFPAPYVPPAAPASPPPVATATAAHPRTPARAAGSSAGSVSSGSAASGLWLSVAVIAAASAVVVAADRIRRRRARLVPAGTGPVVWAPPLGAPRPGPPPYPPAGPAAPPGPVPPAAASPPPSAAPSGPEPETVAADGAGLPSPVASPVYPAVPAGPAPLAAGMVEVQVLGPVRVVGWPGSQLPGQSVLEVLCLLVLHPGERFSTERLREQLGVGRDRDLDAATVRRYLGELRRALGDERVPEARSGGYEVLGVSADAARFDAAVARARQATAGAERAAGLAEALSLVRGAPFSAVPRRSYGWADAGPLASSLANTIHRVALDLAALARSDGHLELAEWALAQGLAVWPTDETFLELRLAVAYHRGGLSELERQWAATTTALARLDAEPSPKLVDTHQLLIDRDRHRGPARHLGLGG